jgi:hypothetical protein
VQSVQVLLRRTADAELQLSFRLDGDIRRVLIPSPHMPRIETELWRHTCFEAFIALVGQPAYHEFNFAPSGDWAVHTFSGYRNGGPLASEMPHPNIVVRSTGRRFELDSVIHLDSLSAIHRRASLRIGLSAVVEATDGFSYWAIRHPSGKPDFHHAECFALMLEPPGPMS